MSLCGNCQQGPLEQVLDLGHTPLADRLLDEQTVLQLEPLFPLRLGFCQHCCLVQLLDTVAPERLYCDNYPYYSSVSPALLDHTREHVEQVIARRGLDHTSRVIEIASNDGYLLHYYQAAGIEVLGIDPAQGPAKAAVERGIPTRTQFFDGDYGTRLREENLLADVVHANNVLAHVPNLHDFLAGLALVLKPGGCAIIEHPYLPRLVEQCQFDTIYHEHVYYFSVTSLVAILAQHTLVLQQVEEIPIHGGSLRSVIGFDNDEGASVRAMLAAEAALGVNRSETYQLFASQCAQRSAQLRTLVEKLKDEGARIAAFGAAAKGCTLLHAAGLGADHIEFVVDNNRHKQGKFLPGSHLPIHAPAVLRQRQPDYTLLLSWNFADEILEQEASYLAAGGRFISPVPEPRII